MSEVTDVQLNPEGTGPLVRTIGVDETQPVDASGNAQADVTRHQQVVGLADSQGNLAADPTVALKAILDAQTRTNELLELVLGALS